jgi:DNA-directed RNA polymerase specialized sigma24 family protein
LGFPQVKIPCVPINMQALLAGNEEELLRAFHELDLWEYAQALVAERIGADFPNDIQLVASNACIKLCRNLAKNTPWVRNRIGQDPHNIRDLLVRYVGDVVKDFLRGQRNQRQVRIQQLYTRDPERYVEEPEDQHAAGEIQILRDLGAENYERALEIVRGEARLDDLETAALDALIGFGMTQEQFARDHGIPRGSVPRISRRVMRKIQAAFGDRTARVGITLLLRRQE